MKYLFIIFILLSTISNAQNSTQKIPRFNFKFSPISLIDIYNGGSVKFGIEYRFISTMSICIEGGKYFKKFNGLGLKNMNGNLFKVELRYYLPNNDEGLFFGLEYYYKEQSFNYSDTVMSIPNYYKEFTVSKYVNTFNLRIGIMKSDSKSFYEFSAGLGYRQKNVFSNLTEYEDSNRIEYRDSQPLFFIATPGKFNFPMIDFSFRVGFSL